MEKLFVNIVNFISDKSISFFKKSFYSIFIIAVVLLINDFFGFSFNYKINQKLNQLSSIQELRSDNDVNFKKQIEYLNILEKQIITRKTFYEKSVTFLNEMFDNKLSVKSIKILKRLFTGTILYWIMIIVSAFSDKKDFRDIFIGFLIIMVASNLLLLIVPTFEKLYINHIINISAGILTFLFLGFYGDDDEGEEDNNDKN